MLIAENLNHRSRQPPIVANHTHTHAKWKHNMSTTSMIKSPHTLTLPVTVSGEE